MIDMNKKYRTRNGRDATICVVKNGWVFGFVGSMRPCIWSAETGKASSRFDDLGGADTDLIEVKTRITQTYWLRHCVDGDVDAYKLKPNRALADPGTIAITGPYEITFEEGEGLE